MCRRLSLKYTHLQCSRLLAFADRALTEVLLRGHILFRCERIGALVTGSMHVAQHMRARIECIFVLCRTCKRRLATGTRRIGRGGAYD